jgi:hypothetical protein
MPLKQVLRPQEKILELGNLIQRYTPYLFSKNFLDFWSIFIGCGDCIN